MWKYLLHLWAVPATDLALVCPAPAEGQPADPQGFYDFVTVAAAFDRVALVSVVLVIVAVVVCYQFTRVSLGPRFVKRWWISLGISSSVTAAATWLLLSTAQTRALAGTCETNPTAFSIPLPNDLITQRTIAGFVWALIAFPLLSLLLTAVVGRFASAGNGFFHNRGCPWPRLTS